MAGRPRRESGSLTCNIRALVHPFESDLHQSQPGTPDKPVRTERLAASRGSVEQHLPARGKPMLGKAVSGRKLFLDTDEPRLDLRSQHAVVLPLLRTGHGDQQFLVPTERAQLPNLSEAARLCRRLRARALLQDGLELSGEPHVPLLALAVHDLAGHPSPCGSPFIDGPEEPPEKLRVHPSEWGWSIPRPCAGHAAGARGVTQRQRSSARPSCRVTSLERAP